MAEEASYDFEDDRGFDDREQPGVGTYHVVVSDVEENGGKNNDQLVVDFTVLSPGDFTGLTYRDFIPMSFEDWARKKRYKLAIVLGMTTLEALKKGGVVLDWKTANGRECVIELIEDKWTDRNGNDRITPRAKWPENYISLDNKAAIAKRGCKLAGKGGDASSKAEPVDPPPKKDDDEEVPF